MTQINLDYTFNVRTIKPSGEEVDYGTYPTATDARIAATTMVNVGVPFWSIRLHRSDGQTYSLRGRPEARELVQVVEER